MCRRRVPGTESPRCAHPGQETQDAPAERVHYAEKRERRTRGRAGLRNPHAPRAESSRGACRIWPKGGRTQPRPSALHPGLDEGVCATHEVRLAPGRASACFAFLESGRQEATRDGPSHQPIRGDSNRLSGASMEHAQLAAKKVRRKIASRMRLRLAPTAITEGRSKTCAGKELSSSPADAFVLCTKHSVGPANSLRGIHFAPWTRAAQE